MQTQKQIDSKINAATARLAQVKSSKLFTTDEKQKQITQIENELNDLAKLKEVNY
tara:strand:+ start:37733 stop:37897 length:165 start_codon:yes stop_codon:yes gene_type:complete